MTAVPVLLSVVVALSVGLGASLGTALAQSGENGFPASEEAPAPPSATAKPSADVIPAKQLFGAIKQPAPITAGAVGGYAGGCLAGRKMLHVNSQGGVEPCMFTQFAVDNIHGKSFSDVLRSKFLGKVRDDERIRANPQKTCLVTDVPEVFRQIVKEEGAKDQSGDGLMTTMAPVLDAFAREDKALHEAEKK